MPDSEDIFDFPEADWKELIAATQKRNSRHVPGSEMCALMNRIVSSYSSDATDLPWQIAAGAVPGFADSLGGLLHALSHFAFEMGRQYEITQSRINYDDISINDLKPKKE